MAFWGLGMLVGIRENVLTDSFPKSRPILVVSIMMIKLFRSMVKTPMVFRLMILLSICEVVPEHL